MMTKKIVSALFLVSAGFAMSGCSLLGQNDEYGCKGMPNSVTCMNVRDVYALTDGDDYQEQIDTASENQLSGKPVEVKRLRTTAGNGGILPMVVDTSLCLLLLLILNPSERNLSSCGCWLTPMRPQMETLTSLATSIPRLSRVVGKSVQEIVPHQLLLSDQCLHRLPLLQHNPRVRHHNLLRKGVTLNNCPVVPVYRYYFFHVLYSLVVFLIPITEKVST